MGIRHTLLLGTNFSPLLQAPSFFHTLGVLGPKTHATSQLFLRDVETVPGVSFNVQSQGPDIPGISSRNTLSVCIRRFFQHPVQGPGHPLAVTE